MTIDVLIEQSMSEKGRLDKDLLKRRFFSLSAPPVSMVMEKDLARFLVAAINLNYGNAVTPEELLDRESAADLFRTKVMEKKIRGRPCWLEIFEHLGTHHPKTQNDKVSSGAVVAEWGGVQEPSGAVSSLNAGSGRPLSGAGNSAYNSHYNFLSLEIQMEGRCASLMEWIGEGHPQLNTIFSSLGMDEGDWNELVKKAMSVMETRNFNHVDRLSKQIFVPCESCSGGYVLLSPLPSTKLIASFEGKRRDMVSRGIRLPVFATKVGGTKPQNAGALPNELGGVLRHLRMGFPQLEQNSFNGGLYRITHFDLFSFKNKKAELRKLKALLLQEWDGLPQIRQNLLTSVEKKVDLLFRDQFVELMMLQAYVSSEYDYEEKRSFLDQPEYRNISPWLRFFLDINLQSSVTSQTQMECFIERGMDALKKAGIAKDDSHIELVHNALEKLVREVMI